MARTKASEVARQAAGAEAGPSGRERGGRGQRGAGAAYVRTAYDVKRDGPPKDPYLHFLTSGASLRKREREYHAMFAPDDDEEAALAPPPKLFKLPKAAGSSAGSKRGKPNTWAPADGVERALAAQALAKVHAHVRKHMGFELAEGWTVSLTRRKDGATTGRYDTYWHSPHHKRCRSMKEVQRLLEKEGNVGPAAVLPGAPGAGGPAAPAAKAAATAEPSEVWGAVAALAEGPAKPGAWPDGGAEGEAGEETEVEEGAPTPQQSSPTLTGWGSTRPRSVGPLKLKFKLGGLLAHGGP